MAKLSEFRIGVVVTLRNSRETFGHVVGFAQVWERKAGGKSYEMEPVIKVVIQWAGEVDYDSSEVTYKTKAESIEHLIIE